MLLSGLELLNPVQHWALMRVYNYARQVQIRITISLKVGEHTFGDSGKVSPA